ncbi:MAG: diguanylate cyclase [Nitrospiraceae bacterium]|nr:diguanylate cyclase [Nitrospiraceae bacterium]
MRRHSCQGEPSQPKTPEALTDKSLTGDGLLRKTETSGICILDPAGHAIHTSGSFARILGYENREIAGRHLSFWNAEWTGPELEGHLSLLRDLPPGDGRIFETHYRRKDGTVFPVEVYACRFDSAGASLLIHSVRDLSAKNGADKTIRRLSDFNTLLSRVGEAKVRHTNEGSLLQEVCSLAITCAPLTLAWIGRPGPGDRFQVLASAGQTECLEKLRISGDPDDLSGMSQAESSFRKAKAIFRSSFSEKENHSPRHSQSFHFVRPAKATLPLFREGKVFAVLALTQIPGEDFERPLQEILLELSRCLSRGLERLDLLAGERRASALNAAILEASSIGILLTQKGLIHYANPRMGTLSGHPWISLPGKGLLSFSAGDDLSLRKASLSVPPGSRDPLLLEVPVRNPEDGSLRWLELSGIAFPQGEYDTLWTVTDVTARRLAREGEELLARAMVSVQEGVVITDARRRILYVNEAFSTITGYSRTEVEGKSCRLLQGTDSSPETILEIHQALGEGRPFRGQILNYKKDGTPFWNLLAISPVKNDGGLLTHYVGVQSDITDLCNLQDQNSRLAHRARHDPLTGLPNRSVLEENLERLVSREQRHGGTFGVGMLDLDDFKPVNDSFGHAAGDRLLKSLAQRLGGAIRSHDLLARLGGDEFVIVIEDLPGGAESPGLSPLLERIHGAVEAPFEVAPGKAVHLGMSLGLSFFPADGRDPESLLRAADLALSAIKRKKHRRTRWWQTAGSVPSADEERPFDPYGEEMAAILEKYSQAIDSAIVRFVENFYSRLMESPEALSILGALNQADREGLVLRQRDHLRFLLSPGSLREEVLSRARQTGRIHCLVGLSNRTLVGSMALYRRLLSEHIARGLIPERERSLLLSVADQRIEDHVEAELESEIATIGMYMDAALSAPDISLSGNPAEREALHLAKLPGIIGVFFLRPATLSGRFLVEASAGKDPEALHRPLEETMDPFPDCSRGSIMFRSSLEALSPEGAFPREEFLASGVRSTVEIPLFDESGHARLLLLIAGAFPNQFGSHWAQQFVLALKQRLESSPLLRHLSPDPSRGRIEEKWMGLLLSGNLVMHLQPVTNLFTGKLHSLEGLARVRIAPDQLLPAGAFLSRMNSVQGARLFRLGLAQTLESLTHLDKEEIRATLSLNINPDLLLHPDLARWIGSECERTGIPTNRLILEISRDRIGEPRAMASAVSSFRRQGIRFALDDMGASHSDLELLTALPWDLVKISPEITGRFRMAPLEALSHLRTLRLAGEELGSTVVLKGVEDEALLEVALFAGFRYAQGYALSRPLPEGMVGEWSRSCRESSSLPTIKSFSGALTFLWSGMQECPPTPHPPLPRCPLTSFLAASPDGGKPLTWHETLHADAASPAAFRNLLHWLVLRVQAGTGLPTPGR